MKTRYTVWTIALILLLSALTLAEEPRLNFNSSPQDSDDSTYYGNDTTTDIIQGGKKIGEIRYRSAKAGFTRFRIKISLDKKEFPKAGDFKEIGMIAGQIYDLLNGVGRDHKYIAKVHLKNYDKGDLPTEIEIKQVDHLKDGGVALVSKILSVF